MQNFRDLTSFEIGVLEDARLFGDGYDFQIQISSRFILAEVKGLRSEYGSIRLTENEFVKAQEHKSDYGRIIVSNLELLPKMTPIFNPTANLKFKKKTTNYEQISYHSTPLVW